MAILPKNVTCDLWNVSLGHPRSPEVTSGFSAITFYWIEIETPFDVYRVCLVNADRMICNMTYLGQVMTLTWGQILNLTFRGHIIHHSMRLDELRTMAFESILYLVWKSSYSRKTIRNKTNIFSSVTSGDLVFDLIDKMTGVLSYWFCPLFRTPLTVCLYHAPESS